MAVEIGDIAQVRAISRRLKMHGLDPDELDEDVQGMLEGMFGCSVGEELFNMLKLMANNELVEYMAENAIAAIHAGENNG